MRKSFYDGLTNVVNKLINLRQGSAVNVITSQRMSESEMRATLITGLGSKIVRLKAGYALNDTLTFETIADEALYKRKMERHVKRAAKFMLGFGRGAIVIMEKGADHSKPLRGAIDSATTRLAVLSGDIIKGTSASQDLTDPRYMKPLMYNARGVSFHHSRVIDFTYVEPSEIDAPTYDYGGVSEFELIRAQIINDGIVERASGTIVEKNSTLFHKIKGFRDALAMGQDEDLIKYYSTLADLRGIYGDGLIDSEDEVFEVAQSLANLADVDQITLRRLAMVTGIPLAILVGESVQGLNATGDNERVSFQDTIENLQFDFLLEPIQSLCSLFGIANVEFKDNQGGTALERITHEKVVIENATALYNIGEDHREYLIKNEVVKKDDFALMFPEVSDE